MKNNRTRLTRDEFYRYGCYYPSNVVIIEMPPEHDLKTPSGINVGFNPDVQYGTVNEEDTSSHVADCADVYGTVVKQVDRLYFNPKDINNSMSWDCDVETQAGDIVWSHPLATKNCEEIQVDDKIYKVLRYEDLFVARRGDEVIPLNGNVILETQYKSKLSTLDVLEPEVDPTRGIVKWVGSNNRRYQTNGIADFVGLKEGDLVVIQKNCYPFYLERSKYNAHFDQGNLYFVIQGRHIMALL
jgi:hypothetical protein